MGADNLEGFQKHKVSKIRIVNNRWAFCINGVDNPIFCIDHMLSEASEKDIADGWPNISEVIGDLALWTKGYTQYQVKQHGNTEENMKVFAAAKENGCTVIIFDAKDFELFECEMTDLYPPESFDPKAVKVTKLEEGVLHLHAMAKNRTGQKAKVQITANFFTFPKVAL